MLHSFPTGVAVGLVPAAWAAFTIFTGAVDPQIDNLAHLGGLIGGAVVALGVKPKVARAA